MQHVRRGVVSSRRISRIDIDASNHFLTDLHTPGDHLTDMAAQTRHREGGVDHSCLTGDSNDRSGVTHLTTALGIERSDVEEDLRLAIFSVKHLQHTRGGFVLVVPDEGGDPVFGDEFAIRLLRALISGDFLARALGSFALGCHLAFESIGIDTHSALTRDLLGQLQREAVRVVEQEGRLTRQRCCALRHFVIEYPHAGPQGVTEAVFFTVENAENEVAILAQVGIGVAHDVDRHCRKLRHDAGVGAEQVGVTHSSTNDAAKHVSPVFVGRKNAIVHEHRRRARMLRQYAQREAVTIFVVSGAVRLAGQ